MRVMRWNISLLLLVTLNGCIHALKDIDCDPTNRYDCTSISPEAVETLANIADENTHLREQLELCEKHRYLKAEGK